MKYIPWVLFVCILIQNWEIRQLQQQCKTTYETEYEIWVKVEKINHDIWKELYEVRNLCNAVAMEVE